VDNRTVSPVALPRSHPCTCPLTSATSPVSDCPETDTRQTSDAVVELSRTLMDADDTPAPVPEPLRHVDVPNMISE
jgi:hypothetical protein